MKKNNALVSIIMPVYNGEQYLEETLGYIINQTYKNWELIIINDGSNDGSKQICDRFTYLDSRIYVIEKENGGIASARNIGLLAAHGDYICFADQDDIIDSNFYETLLKDCEENSCEIAIANVNIFNEKKIKSLDNIKSSQVLTGIDLKKLLLWLIIDNDMKKAPQNTINTSIWNCMFSAELIRKGNITFRRIVQNEDDWIFLIETIALAKLIYLDNRALYTWRIHHSQTTQKRKYVKNLCDKRIEHSKFVDRWLDKLNILPIEKKRYAARHFGRTIFLVVNNEALIIKENNLSKCINQIEKAYIFEKKYVGKISFFLILKQTIKYYGKKNTILVFLVLLRQFKIALKLRAKWL